MDTYFRTSHRWQLQTGVELCFGHGGDRCPTYPAHASYTDSEAYASASPAAGSGDGGQEASADGDDGWENVEEVNSAVPPRPGSMADELRLPLTCDVWDNPVLTVVHTNGLHYLRAKFCKCPNAPSPDVQVLMARMYPATQLRVQTVFTQAVLDDCMLNRVECKTSTHNYFAKLRRQTSSVFPQLVPVRHSAES